VTAKDSAPRGPIFLAGVDRSGIGLVGELIEAHQDLSMSRRTNFWTRFAGRYGDLAVTENFERMLNDLARHERVGRLQPDLDALRAVLRNGPMTDGRLFSLIHEHHMQRTGRRRWGDKSLGNEQAAEAIFAAYPDAVMVHVVRDPRDRYCSQATHRRAGRGGAGAGAALWRWSVALAERNQASFGQRYLVVRYEDLVTTPSVAALAIFDHIGEAVTAEVHAFELHGASVGRYRRDLSRSDAAFIDLVLGSPMRRHGYTPDPASTRSKVVTFLRSPRRAAGMLLWRPDRRS
jgi:hypothetical protein